ncbi:uncharacterized protein LOC105762058 [Gossypium raimondii]|uniref:uncharacterized protein LOC105762058 n=1 Tax=Gossypium raimondii TaxID=29730 RepID=UPI00063ADB95|nr:uncharacterized protein LOC105762058 [Gossypium raimondii]
MGDLGFRDLRCFNVALLERQVWRLASCKDTMVISFGQRKLTSRLLRGRLLLELHVFCMRASGGTSIYLNRREVHETRVSELIDGSNAGWKEERVREIFGEYMGDQIYKIPTLHSGLDDHRIWFHNQLGSYSTKSTYSWMTLKYVGFGPHHFAWRLIWKLHTLPKIKVFCWRMGHDILPTYENISKIRKDFDCMCARCGTEKETLFHALKDCPKARAVLTYRGIDNALVDGHYRRCVDCFEDAARSLDKKALSNFVTVLWNIWNSKNNKVFRNTDDEARVIWDRAAMLNKDFCIYNFLEKPLIPKSVGEKR